MEEFEKKKTTKKDNGVVCCCLSLIKMTLKQSVVEQVFVRVRHGMINNEENDQET